MNALHKQTVIQCILAALLVFSCGDFKIDKEQNQAFSASENETFPINDSLIYQTEQLTIQKLSNHTYVHTSFLQTQDFGKVSCNGMVVVYDNEAVVFDTPVDNKSSGELIDYIIEVLGSKIKAVIPTHFHDDCVGGMEAFNDLHITCYASNNTLTLLNEKDFKFARTIKGFDEHLTLNIGDKEVIADFLGEGHTSDNIIGYFPEDKVIFGGCLIKELNAGKGYLGDANVHSWSETVEKVKQRFHDLKIVIPGHGKSGGTELLDYTINLFQ